MKLENIAHVSDLQDRKVLRLKGAGYDVCVVLTDNKVHAFANRCPHTGARLQGSRVRHNVITCSHHLAQFDLCSGAVLTYPMEGLNPDATGPLVLYQVEIDDDGRISVDTDAERLSAEEPR